MTQQELVREDEYLALLELSYEVAQSLAGGIPEDQRRPDCQMLAAKLYFHAASIHWLSQGTNAPVPRSNEGTAFIDGPSIAVLTRAAFEAYLTMYEVFFEPESDDDFEFNYLLWQLAGFVVREGWEPTEPELHDAYVQAQADIEELRNRIRATERFASLTRKQKKAVLKGKRIRRKMDVAESAGFGQEMVSRLWSYYSDHAHSGGMAAGEIFEAKTLADQREMIQIHIVTTAIVLSKMILSYANQFEQAMAISQEFKKTFDKAQVLSGSIALVP